MRPEYQKTAAHVQTGVFCVSSSWMMTLKTAPVADYDTLVVHDDAAGHLTV